MYKTSFAPQPKVIPSGLLFDATGVELHARIDHFVKAEQAILHAHAPDIAAAIGPLAHVVFLTTGDGIRTAQLVSKLQAPAQITLVDRSPRDATRAARLVGADRPGLPFVAVDATSPWDADASGDAFYLGDSVIGELEPRAARAQLKRIRDLTTAGGHLLVGIDLKKDAWTHEQTYAPAEAFAKYALTRMNDHLAASFDLDGFEYVARFDAAHGRVELQLVSKRWQWATISGRWVHFDAGEAITVMIATKYTIEWFGAVAALAGWKLERVFLDPKRTYALVLLRNG